MKYKGKHNNTPARNDRVGTTPPAIATTAAAIAAIAIAIVIFTLTSQTPEETSAMSSTVNDLVVAVLGWIPGLYDPSADQWLGIDIRHWAHAFEFGALGLFVTLASAMAMRPRILAPAGMSLAICALCSILDQCHKLFVPGRHFDSFDLCMDALGYGLAIALVMVVRALISRNGNPR